MSQSVLIHGALATMTHDHGPDGLVPDGALAMEGGRIAWVGPADDLPRAYAAWPQEDVEGRLVTPGLIDCHTHLVHGGHRAREFELRLKGASYADVAQAGGGIVATMTATRAADEAALVTGALPRLDALIAEGVTAVEVKSGYGLTVADEIKMLRAARRLENERPVRVSTTWLAAHAVPPEYRTRADAYLDDVVHAGLDQAYDAGLVDAVDAFCETIAFSPTQVARLFDHAQDLMVPIKVHAEQLSNQGGAMMAARRGALSADHLEHLDTEGIAAMAAGGTVAVLLPGAYYTLRDSQPPPVEALRAAGVPLAVATDCNPGSSPLTSPLLAMNMACTLFRLTPHEALAGMTRCAARALGLQDRMGTLEAGKRADLAVWSVEHPAELAYRLGFNPLHRRLFGGVA
ncbi:imidazolonepropionase [Roseospira visakhapatnamensis]|uniref:Imidazolonepropionase n=1 Tax=Roseospira visakhapatnamensis TaxID=390880 RepID=A0A7W6RCB1_9PROT|nr:imidazolonepropionase [Roseospira visakhapatnamensis]MBB4265364.1 imidazolonepropionase [Roseospira visakhapatnamensis]